MKPINLIYLTLSVAICAPFCGCNYSADRHNCSGTQAFMAGNVNQAINDFQQALISNPQDANAFYNLGYSYAALGKQTKNAQQTQQAEQLLRQSLAIDDKQVNAHRALAALMIENGKEKDAYQLLTTWQQKYPTDPAPLVELAKLYQDNGDNRRAADYLADSIRLDSQNPVSLVAMGEVREAQGQTQLAMQNYMRALQIDSSQPEVAQRVAVLQQQMAQNPNPAVNQDLNRYGAASPFDRR